MSPKRLQNPLDPHLIDREIEKTRIELDKFRGRYRWLFDMAYYRRRGTSANETYGTSISSNRELTEVEIVAEIDPKESVYPRRRKKLARALMKLQRARMDLESAVAIMSEGAQGPSDSESRALSRSEMSRLKKAQSDRAQAGGGFGVS